ncbi:MAG: aminotransferase class III-fold pyridoxal phosphate-dependent enzyme, partial [Pseudomonadota bacterium]
AVMISDRVAAVFEDDETGAGSVDQGYTYSGHPVGAAAAVAALEETMRIRPWENARVRGAQLKAGLDALAERYDMIGDVRGEGLMCAIELVSDRANKMPAAKALPLTFQKAAYEDGVMIRVSGNNAIFSPPLVVEAGHVDKILSATETGLRAMAEAA